MTEARAAVELRALAHPLRLRILALLRSGPRSAAELARELGVVHASASYHLRTLAAAGFVELAEEREHRGGRERRYRRLEPRLPRAVSADDRSAFARAALAEARRRLELLDVSLPTTMGDDELWVDANQWADVVARVRAAVHDLESRPPGSEDAVPVSATVLLFGLRRPAARDREP